MNKKYIWLFAIISLLIYSCNRSSQQDETPKVDESEYEECFDSVSVEVTDTLADIEDGTPILPHKYKTIVANPYMLQKLNSLVSAGYYDTKVPTYKVSEEGKQFIKNNEGCFLKPYWDCKGWSVGYGHFIGGKKSHRPKTITRWRADYYFDKDIAKIEKRINDLLNNEVCTRGYVVPQCFIDGLADFMFNCGVKRIDGMEFYNRIKNNTRWYDPTKVETDLYFCSKFLRNHIVQAKDKNGKYQVLRSLVDRRNKEADYMQNSFLYLLHKDE